MICYKCMREYTGSVCNHCGFNPSLYENIPTALLPMTVLHNQYILGIVLGKGGFGITYTGYDNINMRKVAIKEFFPSSVAYRDSKITTAVSVQPEIGQIYENGVNKFYIEALTLSRLQDIPAIVGIYDFFYENNTAYIVMEFIDGTAVDQIVLNQGPLDIDITLTIYYPIIQALESVHSAGILHRDISPSNVMLDDKYNARLIDLGSSRAYSHEMSTDLTVILKKGFAPVEQYMRKGRHSPAEDVYAVCASMYYTLTGKVPPAATDRMVFDTLMPISSFGVDVPQNIADIILKGMAIRADDRYSSMFELAEAIDSAVCGSGDHISENRVIDEHHDKKRDKKQRRTGINPQILLLAVSGTLFIILLIILFFIVFKGR